MTFGMAGCASPFTNDKGGDKSGTKDVVEMILLKDSNLPEMLSILERIDRHAKSTASWQCFSYALNYVCRE